MSKDLRIGFIGTGGIARAHMTHLAKIPGVQIVCAADISEAALGLAKDTYRIPRVYADYREMLRQEKDLDAVDICTPNSLHAPNAIAAFEAGLHVMVEKPMAMNAAEAQAMLDASKRAGKQLIIGFQHRFDARTKFLKDHIESGAFGKILYVRAQALRRRGIPNWGVFGRKDLQGGGPMIDIGVHILETSHYLMGSPAPVSVTGNTWTYLGHTESLVASMWPKWDYKTYTVEDLAVGMIRFNTGVMLTIESSFVAHVEKDIFNIQVMGEKGGAVWDVSQVFADQGGYMVNLAPAFLPIVEPFEYKMKHFVEVCRDGRENEAPGEHGVAVQKMLDGVYASAEKSAEVRVD